MRRRAKVCRIEHMKRNAVESSKRMKAQLPHERQEEKEEEKKDRKKKKRRCISQRKRERERAQQYSD